MHRSDIAKVMAKAMARSRSQLPRFIVLSERRQLNPAAISLLLFTTLSPPRQ
jgi:hypothetical protein